MHRKGSSFKAAKFSPPSLRDPSTRGRIYELIKTGQSTEGFSKITGVCQHTVRKWRAEGKKEMLLYRMHVGVKTGDLTTDEAIAIMIDENNVPPDEAKKAITTMPFLSERAEFEFYCQSAEQSVDAYLYAKMRSHQDWRAAWTLLQVRDPDTYKITPEDKPEDDTKESLSKFLAVIRALPPATTSTENQKTMDELVIEAKETETAK